MRIKIERITVLSLLMSACSTFEPEERLFELVNPSESDIEFINYVEENKGLNIIEYLYFYNGGGVAIGDINNDDLPDIYFTSNQGSNQLYLNKGGMSFENITERSGVAGESDWSTGATMADVNGDGYQDIYVCNVSEYKGLRGRNELFINNGDNTFTEKAQFYGLGFKGFSTQAAFFDYDMDGDLDMYLLNHAVHTRRSYGSSNLRYEKAIRAGDRLFNNDFSGKEPYFEDVTDESGIFRSLIGYGLGISMGDINQDGCIDIYVSNDFHENDYLYMNNCDGTFTEKLQEMTGHSSRFSMGNDIADYNNDGHPDIISLDMLPEDESILKKSAGEESNKVSDIKLSFGYHPQLARNTLQLNNADGTFSEIALFADIYATDWSWAPLFADFDNDGFKDLFISNGIWKRPNDLDYINYVSNAGQKLYKEVSRDSADKTLISLMPTEQISNYAFKNHGGREFENVSEKWGFERGSFSNGSAYGDLDNDGDLDLVVNNINQKAFLYENLSDNKGGNYLKFKFKGQQRNPQGIGTRVFLKYSDTIQFQQLTLTKGYISSVNDNLIFGVGVKSSIDTVKIIWPNKKQQYLTDLATNQTLTIDYRDATDPKQDGDNLNPTAENKLFSAVNKQSINYKHQENDYKDYDVEYLIPHKLSTLGPAMAVGDINNDGLDDFFVGGAKGQTGKIFIQDAFGNFSTLDSEILEQDKDFEDVDALFFDVDLDNDLDLIVAGGGNEINDSIRTRTYRFQKGNIVSSETIHNDNINASCLAAHDYDQDGDMDLFIGSRSVPGAYGVSPRQYLLKNDGQGNFTIAKTFEEIGMVSDAVWSDNDGDGRKDLVLVGEWMPVTILRNTAGSFDEAAPPVEIKGTSGWWNTIENADLDSDGDEDYLLGNFGLNMKVRTVPAKPATLYVNDFDSNGSIDPILAFYKDEELIPFPSLGNLATQIVSIRKKFYSHRDFSNVRSIDDLFDPEQMDGMVIKEAEIFESGWMNNEDGKLKFTAFPEKAQYFPVFAIETMDFNNDGTTDILLGGNLTGASVNYGRYDAGYGLLLKGQRDNSYKAITPLQSGIQLKGEVRKISKIIIQDETFFIVARNNDSLMIIKQNKGIN